ncbi:TniQ family protein [Endozoicomonas gorgoniicola]|uniref:TniQ family protein n=1 Tax=Endozoicomonas gorgoniicola TaxID=1234144 RepID=A0ABT3N3K8_9GAMM|nr:TniQ family protein [Endozoicomonas gorgoniicola]MCW7555928.1 TniQ family protein [Endozoicomonas gorgoniicola]
MLLRPKSLRSEALESYMIRLADLYGYTSQQLIERFHIILDEEDQKLSGALPGNLWQLNIYHANTSSSFRVECLEVLAEKMGRGRLPIMELAVYRSRTKYGLRHHSLFWQGLDIPRFYVRKECIPVCPLCFQEDEKPFMPFYWHLHLVRACSKHGCKLIEQCPDCMESLNYIHTGNLKGCSCGKEYKSMPAEIAPEPLIHLAAKVQEEKVTAENFDNLLFELEDIHQLFGMILWFYSYVAERGSKRSFTDETLLDCIAFFDKWPQNLHTLLKEKIETAIVLADRRFSETSFQSIFRNLLFASKRLPSNVLSSNPVLKEVFTYLDQCIHADNELSEIGYSLLNGYEVATLLDTDDEQVARLLDEGKLPVSKRLKDSTAFNPKIPLFPLKSTFNVWLAGFQSRLSNRHIYMSRW